ncbi:MAG: cytochrome c3 family protein [Thermoanaerobaculia bacterium]|nr:cytochrome c3 family protein [Thermoanaerobaculia bacterium]
MSQIFHPSTNTISRVSIFAVVLTVAFAGWIAAALDRSAIVTRKNVILEQPVPFSHDHHVGEIGIDCRYCHTSVETSAFAGLPPTSTCMNCHNELFKDSPMLEPVRESFRSGQPIEWTRVNDVPDFVYFNHSIHVAKGIGCTSCHGKINKMPITWKAESLKMEWCLACHRDPAQQVRPREEVFNVNWDPSSITDVRRAELIDEYNIQSKTSCSTCHR